MAASIARTTPLPLLRDAATAARGVRSCLHRLQALSAARRLGVRCSGTPPPEVPWPPPAEVPGSDRSLEELPSIILPPEFDAPPGLDVPMPGTPKPGPEQPGPSIPSPPMPEVPNVPRNPDVPPPQPPDVDPPRPPPEVVPEPPAPDVEPPTFIV